MTRSLGPTQRLVLAVLDDFDLDEGPPTAAEIADQIPSWNVAHRLRRPTAEAEAAQGCLARLARRGLVQRLGTAHNGARCWAITDAGRAALAEDGAS